MNAGSSTQQVWAVHAMLVVWAAVLLVAGIAWISEPVGPVCIGAAGFTVVAVVLGLAVWTWMEGLYGALLVAAGATVATGVVAGETPDLTLIALGVVGVIVVGGTAPLAYAARAIAARPSGSSPGSIAAPAPDQADVLNRLHEISMLSDNAKRVLFRDRELELLHNAINEDIEHGHYNAALTLCDAMGTLYGQRQEAEDYRARIMNVRRERYELEIDDAMRRFEQLLGTRDWATVYQERARLRRLYPDSHLVEGLDQRIVTARDEHKHDLERRFLEAAERESIDEAMALLRELDKYLDTDEAERLSAVAQGVITRHRELLGDRFRSAVNEHRWAEAAHAGEKIMNEFPNSKMADEVGAMIEVLRTRATEAAVSGRT